MCDVEDFPLFTLLPICQKATTTIDNNRRLGRVLHDCDHITVHARQRSNRRGLITFGRESDNDIVYFPASYTRYLSVFTLTPNGDVVLIDAATFNKLPQTGLTVAPVSRGSRQALDGYSMSIEGGHAQQRRVIPMASGFDVRVEIGKQCKYRFEWLPKVDTPEAVAQTRALLRRIYANAPQQYYVDYQGEPLSGQAAAVTRVAPLMARKPPSTHPYGALWRKTTGRMHEVVVLGSGQLFAVKTLKCPRRDGEQDEGARLEWKRLAKLQSMSFDSMNHLPIFISSLDDSHDALYYYYPIYGGNVRDLIDCRTDSSVPPELVAQCRSEALAIASAFTVHMFNALAYLDQHGIVHGNIKPENVLFEWSTHMRPGNYLLEARIRFALTDFAFGEAGGAALGTVGYMAPETVRYGTQSGKTDLYALGVSVLEMLRVLQVDEFARGWAYWREKMEALSGTSLEDQEGEGWEHGHKQVQALCESGVLSAALEGMLRLPSDKRLDLHGARQAFTILGDQAIHVGPSV